MAITTHSLIQEGDINGLIAQIEDNPGRISSRQRDKTPLEAACHYSLNQQSFPNGNKMIQYLVDKTAQLNSSWATQKAKLLSMMRARYVSARNDRNQALCLKIESITALILRKSRDYTHEFIGQEWDLRQALGHFNSIRNTDTAPYYESAAQGTMGKYLEESISSLFPELVAMIGNKDLKKFSAALKAGEECMFSNNEMPLMSRRIKNGDLAILPAGYFFHSIYLVFFNGYLIVCNRGPRQRMNGKKPTISAFKIDPSKFSLQMLNQIKNQKAVDRAAGLTFFYQTLPEALLDETNTPSEEDPICRQLETLTTGPQHACNCSFASLKEALMGAFALMHIENHEGIKTLSMENVRSAKKTKQLISAHGRAHLLNQYLEMHEIFQQDPQLKRLLNQQIINACLPKTMIHLNQMGISVSKYPAIDKYLKERPDLFSNIQNEFISSFLYGSQEEYTAILSKNIIHLMSPETISNILNFLISILFKTNRAVDMLDQLCPERLREVFQIAKERNLLENWDQCASGSKNERLVEYLRPVAMIVV